MDKASIDSHTDNVESGFRAMDLGDNLHRAIEKAGYSTPTPIQSQIIPHMLAGRDVLAQSQTGTGKTAAFALPILERIDVNIRRPQAIILAPTRELAIQVSKSFSTYGSNIRGLKVATIYGGQSYDPQLRQLKGGAQIVVGTPGRVIDHLNRGTLDISQINCLVLDEADEMLNMGFIEDVQLVLEKTPSDRQIALFSATVPSPIRSIAERYLNSPARVTVKKKTMTADSIRQRALILAPRDKVDALLRFLESEETDGVIVFTNTRAASLKVAESLCQEKIAAVALNGEMPQATRERTVDQFKRGRIDVLVATDVAARGLDVSRVSHVFNFDLPQDAESYVHRIGRTGRAGRSGEAVIFLTKSQRGKLRAIEKVTKKQIEYVSMPTTAQINALRIKRFKQQITDVTANQDLTFFKDLIETHAAETGQPIEMVAAALAHMRQQGKPFLAKDRPKRERREAPQFESNSGRQKNGARNGANARRQTEGNRKPRQLGAPKPGMERYRIEVGRKDGVEPRNIVGAIANEAGLEGEFIGPIAIHDTFAIVDLPEGMPADIHRSLRKTRVAGKKLRLELDDEAAGQSSRRSFTRSANRRPSKSKSKNVSSKRNKASRVAR